jgi:hypothetical protein
VPFRVYTIGPENQRQRRLFFNPPQGACQRAPCGARALARLLFSPPQGTSQRIILASLFFYFHSSSEVVPAVATIIF